MENLLVKMRASKMISIGVTSDSGITTYRTNTHYVVSIDKSNMTVNSL